MATSTKNLWYLTSTDLLMKLLEICNNRRIYHNLHRIIFVRESVKRQNPSGARVVAYGAFSTLHSASFVLTSASQSPSKYALYHGDDMLRSHVV